MTDQARAAYEAHTVDQFQGLRDQVANAAISEEGGIYSFDPRAWERVCTPPAIRALIKAYDAALATQLTEPDHIVDANKMVPAVAAHETQSTLHSAACDVPGLRNVPAGFVLVPVEPDAAMEMAWDDAHGDGAPFHAAYAAMIAAAPAQPAATHPQETPHD